MALIVTRVINASDISFLEKSRYLGHMQDGVLDQLEYVREVGMAGLYRKRNSPKKGMVGGGGWGEHPSMETGVLKLGL